MIAIFAEVSGNRSALEAIISDARGRGAHRFASIGNLVGIGKNNNWCIENDDVFDFRLRGIYEDYLIGESSLRAFGSIHRSKLLKNSADTLSDDNKIVMSEWHKSVERDSIIFTVNESNITAPQVCFPVNYRARPFMLSPNNQMIDISDFSSIAISDNLRFFPGMVTDISSLGVAYYAIISNTKMTIHKIEYDSQEMLSHFAEIGLDQNYISLLQKNART